MTKRAASTFTNGSIAVLRRVQFAMKVAVNTSQVTLMVTKL